MVFIWQSQTARGVPYDNSISELTAITVQDAIDELHIQAESKGWAITMGYNSTAGVGKWFEFFTGLGSNTQPLVFPKDTTLVALSIATNTTSTGTVSIYKNGTTLIVAAITLTGTKKNYIAISDVPFLAGDTLGAKVTSGSFDKPLLICYFKT
jgi:hypothetical protein